MAAYQFIPVNQTHRSFILPMLAEPEVRAWWGDPEHEWNLIVEGEDRGESRGFVVEFDGTQLGYIQCWIPLWDETYLEIEPWQADIPKDNLGIDISLSSKGMGHGAKIIRAFALKLFDEGTPRLTIDPDATNARAIRAYEKAGFRVFDDSYVESHSVLLMEMMPDNLEIS